MQQSGQRSSFFQKFKLFLTGTLPGKAQLDSHDAAKLRQAEEALRKSEERFRLVQEATLDNFTIFVPIKDEQGHIIDFTWDYLNPVAERVVGSMEQMRGKHLLELYPNTQVSGLYEAYIEVIETGVSKEIETHFVRDDIERWYRNVIVRSGEGVAVTSVNISATKRAEQDRIRLLEQEQLARWSAEAASARLLFLEEASKVLNSSLDYKLTLQNLAQQVVPQLADWCSVHVVDERGLPQQVALAHFDPAKVAWALDLQRELETRYPYDPNAPAGLPNVLRTGQPELYPDITDEMLVATAQDEEQLQLLRQIKYSSVIIVALVARGHVIGALQLVATDESGQHYNEQDLKIAQELAQRAATAVDNARLYDEAQQAIAARDKFLSIAAHELKTPVTSMRGFTQLLLRQIDRKKELDPARLRTMIETTEAQAAKLSRLINRLLDLSKVESGKLLLEPEPTDLALLLRQTVEAVQTTTAKHEIKLLAPPTLLVLVDPLRFEQVLVNFLDNAIKYSPEGGLILVTLAASDPHTVSLSIKDQGVGIAPEHRASIFEPFYQAHERGYAGLGVGLYVSRQIVQLHGGQIAVTFPPEGGTCFTITIPVGLDQPNDQLSSTLSELDKPNQVLY